MSDRFNTSQSNVVDQDNRNMKAAGYPMSAEINDLWSAIDTGAIGIESNAGDVDNLAVADRNVSHDPDSDSGLSLGYKAGQIYVPGTGFVAVTASTIALSASLTNYVEADYTGAVSKNTSGFTLGKFPLFIVVTGPSTITSVTPAKPLLICFPSTGLPGSVLSANVRKKQKTILVGTLSATGAVKIPAPSSAATVTRISFCVDTTVSGDDTNYWTFTALNKGPSGTGTTALDNASNANTTKATGGSALTAYIDRALSLTGTGANLITAANDVLVFTATKTASGANLVNFTITVEFDITG